MSDEQEGNIYVVEQVELSSDSDTEELLEEVHELDELQNSMDDFEGLDGLMRSTLRQSGISLPAKTEVNKTYQPKHVKRLEVVDDYIRNFLSSHGMNKTLNSFQKEWYECVKGK